MALTLSTFNALLKEYYTNETVNNLVYKDRPLLALIPKEKKFPGRELPIPTIFANPQGRSVDFPTAQTASLTSTTQPRAFNLTRTKDYGIVTIDTEAMEASETDEGAWMDARTTEIDGIIQAVSNSLATAMYRSGWGDIGKVVTLVSTTGVTVNGADINNFEYGMAVVFAAAQSTGALRAGGALVVSGVDRNSGTVTFSTSTAGITGLAVGDYIFCNGDRQNTGSPVPIKCMGLGGWNPFTAPTVGGGDNFFGVDRSVDSRLYGQNYNGTSATPEDACIALINRVCQQGGNPDYLFMSFYQFAKLISQANANRRYVNVVTEAGIGFEAVELLGPKGPVKIVPDQFCPRDFGYLVQLDKLRLYSIGEAVRVIENDGLMALRQPSLDGVEVRVGFKGNLGCWAPVTMGTVQFAP